MTPEPHHTEQHQPRPFRLFPWRSVAKVIGEQVKQQGHCCVPQSYMAKCAGMTIAAVDKELSRLCEEGMIEIEHRSNSRLVRLPSIIRITSPTWLSLLWCE